MISNSELESSDEKPARTAKGRFSGSTGWSFLSLEDSDFERDVEAEIAGGVEPGSDQTSALGSETIDSQSIVSPARNLPWLKRHSLELQSLEMKLRRERLLDYIFRGVTWSSAALVPALLIDIVISLWAGSLPAIHKFGWHFLTSANWDPVGDKFGAIVPVYGTIMTSIIALLIAVPVSFGIALFLTELAPRYLRTPLGVAIELLAAIPSIIYGMWGLFVFAPFFANYGEPWLMKHLGHWPVIGAFFQGPPMGIGMFTAGFILAIMIIPFIASVMRDVFQLVPPLLKESAYGMGATTWEVVIRIVLPQTRVGVLGGVILGLGRAFGETMAVTFVIGNAHDLSRSLFMPGSTISSALANEFTEAVGRLYTSSLIELGLILFVVTFCVLAGAKWILMRMKRSAGAAA